VSAEQLSTVAFDIAAVPDVAGIRRIYDLDAALSDSDVAEYAFQRQRATSGCDDLPPHLLRVVEISFAQWGADGLTVSSLAADDVDEASLLARFVAHLSAMGQRIACWGGARRQQPVLRLRTLVHAAVLSEGLQRDPLVCFDEILDLSQRLEGVARGQRVPLVQLAQLLGAPRFVPLGESGVWDAWRGGATQQVTMACERQAVEALRVLLHLRCLAGGMSAAEYALASREMLAHFK